MVAIAEFVIPAEDFDIGRVFADLPGVRFEFERIIPMPDVVVPFVWIRGASAESVERAAKIHEAIRAIRLIDTVGDDQLLFRIEWSRSVENTFATLVDMNLNILSARGSDAEWRFEFRAETHERAREFLEYCREREVRTKLVRIHGVNAPAFTDHFGLSEAQYEALVLASQLGYFREPRESSLEDIAPLLDISRQALARRIRRGLDNLLDETILQE
ncbi:helix-turn-helix domain-containing protein [Haladaptatus cibarius]|uniref:helix-turn-helix domain-containing protein n=1 Tax=Haladaptatus cibarius TaxID=453847 RepID=UPI00067872D9|nr:bacterio-opsin activator domain-containing protein [Haladaptatus cibarius]